MWQTVIQWIALLIRSNVYHYTKSRHNYIGQRTRSVEWTSVPRSPMSFICDRARIVLIS